MKNKLRLTSILVAANLIGVIHGFGQTTNADFTARDRDARDRDNEMQNGRAHFGKLEEASHLLGREIKDSQDQKLGKVKDLAIDLRNGRIVEVIVAIGGVMGMDEQLTAVPPGQFTCDPAAKTLQLKGDQALLKSAPTFKMADWESNVREAYVTEVYQHYDSRPYFTADATVSNSMPVRGSNAMPSVTSSREMANHNNSSTNAAGATMATATSQPVEHLGGVERASKLIGMTALNMENEKLGKVENLLVDLPAGRVAEVIISTGGFLGIGGELSAVPPQSLGIGAVRDTVSLDTTKEALAAAPHYKASELSNLDNPEQVQSVYRSYHVEPYFNTNAVDNTAQNVRDRQENTMTPLDQSNTPADLDLTRQVRQQIMALKGLSVDAQNVKIITVNGRVTLRGPVNSEDEKRQIAEIVARVNPSATVDNQIEVKDSSYNHTGSNQ